MTLLLVAGTLMALPLVAEDMPGMNMPKKSEKEGKKEDKKVRVTEAVAVLVPTDGNRTAGTVIFTRNPEGGIRVQARVTGLKPGKHGFHIHQYGNLSSKDGSAAGPHYNPEDLDHGNADSTVKHSGDMGNILADAAGVGTCDIIVHGLKLDGKSQGIIGRSVIVHEKEDDGVTQPSGASGARLAVGLIGVTKEADVSSERK